MRYIKHTLILVNPLLHVTTPPRPYTYRLEVPHSILHLEADKNGIKKTPEDGGPVSRICGRRCFSPVPASASSSASSPAATRRSGRVIVNRRHDARRGVRRWSLLQPAWRWLLGLM